MTMPRKAATNSPKLFIGIDIHKKSWKIHFCTDISAGSTKTCPPDADALYKYVLKYYMDHEVSVAYEAGCCGFVAAREFESFGWDTYVLNPADIPRPAKQSIIKTDKIDARNISKQLRSGNLNKITIPPVERECLRSLCRHRSNLLRSVKQSKNRIKGMLLYYGVDIPEEFDNANWSIAFQTWLLERKWNYQSISIAWDNMMTQYKFLDNNLKEMSNQMRAYCRKNLLKDYDLLRSVPGIAGLSAAYLLAEAGDMRRFTSFKRFAGYVGLMPGLYSSGDNDIIKGVTPRSNRTLRSIFVESSWVAIRHDPVLQKYYRKHCRKNSKAAIFKVARKLASRVHAVIKTETPYVVGLIS